MGKKRRRPLHIAFVWNMHQPFYKDLVSSQYMLPWVRLHGIKDYYGMAHILRNFPEIHQTFNLVPSLLKQIQDYTQQGFLGIDETTLHLTLKPADELTPTDKVYLLINCFMCNWQRMVYPYPRFKELLVKRGLSVSAIELEKIQAYFTNQEYLDLQVWASLCWIDPYFNPRVKDLFERGVNFREEDKVALLTVQEEIMRLIVPEYRALAENGQIELITSPMYHPILPLLCDSEQAMMALPDIKLPNIRFTHPEDAVAQLEKGIACFKDIMGLTPQGMWPSEGSVSQEVVGLIAKAGIKWIATDEQILAKSLDMTLSRDEHERLRDPAVLYQPYLAGKPGEEISMIFRDYYLSDLIGFKYSQMDSGEAAKNFINNFLSINDSLPEEGDYLVSIILDGENAWEYFPNQGRDFLSFVYEGITNEPLLQAVTVSEYLKEHPPANYLENVFSGSWINHNFRIWIGHDEDNSGWEQIEMTRNALLEYQKANPENADIIAKAWEEIYVAEGSDWFWWYGDDHNSANDDMFDNMFRRQLINVYNMLSLDVPECLYVSNIIGDKRCLPEAGPKGFINPTIDGKLTDYFDWIGAGFFDATKNICSGHQTMHQNISQQIICGIYYGFNLENLFLRVDFSKPWLESVNDWACNVNLLHPAEYKLEIKIQGFSEEKKLSVQFYRRRDAAAWEKISSQVKVALCRILEVKIPLSNLNVKSGDELFLTVSVEKDDLEVERWPGSEYMVLEVPAEDFEAEMWQV